MKKVSEGLIVAACFTLAFVAGFCSISAYKYYTSPSLPQPPTMTVAELSDRVTAAATEHMEMCEVCKSAERLTNPCGSGALQASLIVGDWEALYSHLDKRTVMWQYIGTPLESYRWSIMRQCWIRPRKVVE